MNEPRAGYTLPVFACASAIAAFQTLKGDSPPSEVSFNLLTPDQVVTIAIEQVARLSGEQALAITRSDPGDNLDLTRHTPVWASVQWAPPSQPERVCLIGGEGIGQHAQGAAIYAYARSLIQTHLTAALSDDERIQVAIVLPEGRRLAVRTSNAAFGVVDGLSLLGTSGIAQPLSAPGQLDACRAALQNAAEKYDDVVFCFGENGLDLALKQGIAPDRRVKTANWVGPMLVSAGELGIQSVLLFGYHGKLMKLAGGIFHTHHHLADGRQEVLTAYAAQAGLPHPVLKTILSSQTAEAALGVLVDYGQQTQTDWVEDVYGRLAEQIDVRSQRYIQAHAEKAVRVGSVLFNRERKIVVSSTNAQSFPFSG